MTAKLEEARRMPLVRGFVVAIATVALTSGIRSIVHALWGEVSGFLPYIVAVVFTTWVAGWRPALLAAVLGAIAGGVPGIPPNPPITKVPQFVAGVGLYTLACVLCVLIRVSLDRERMRWLSDLLTSHQRLLLALRAARLAGWSRDLATGELTWSVSLDYVFGSAAATIGTNNEFLAKVHPEDVDRLRRTIDSSIHAQRGYEAEYRVVREDETIRWVFERGEVAIDADGVPIRMNGVTMDVTDRKQQEASDQAARLALEQFQSRESERVESEVRRVRDELIRQTRLSAIGQLSSSVAHDLRNPLGVIRNAVYLLRRRMAKTDLKPDLLNMIDDEVKSADAIITNLMEMTRGREPRRSDVDLHALVNELAARIDSSGRIEWSIETEPSPFLLWCDPGQFRQVLDNLLQNAVEAMKGRGPVRITAWREVSLDIVELRDSGPGIAPEIRDVLFEPLVTTKRTGTGLGLMVSRQIVARHGGTIEWVDNGEPGATFRITLPAHATTASEDRGGVRAPSVALIEKESGA